VPTETETDGRKSSQGIPEVEKKLSFATEPLLAKVPSAGTISKVPKKLSTFSLHSTGEADGNGSSGGGGGDELPLQRRNSIHNVPYVDVNDPATRERMERYKEERRSMLRAKYRVEDYREKPVVSPTGKATLETRKSGEEVEKRVSDPGMEASAAAAGAKRSADVDKTSPTLHRFRKSTPTSLTEKSADKSTVDKLPEGKVSVDKMCADKSPKSDKKMEKAFDAKVAEHPLTTLRKLPVEKAISSPKSGLSDHLAKPADSADTPVRKWTSTSSSRTSLNSFDNKKVSVAIVEADVPLRKVATLKTDVIVPPTPQKPIPTLIPTHPEVDPKTGPHFPAKNGRPASRSSCPAGAVDDDVNVRERAAIFNTAAAHRANQAELRTKFVSLNPPSGDDAKLHARKSVAAKLAGPGSPNKIKNIAALFEQKT
jgi:hypothetical protein